MTCEEEDLPVIANATWDCGNITGKQEDDHEDDQEDSRDHDHDGDHHDHHDRRLKIGEHVPSNLDVL